MADSLGQTDSDLMQSALDAAPEDFSLFQVLRLLERKQPLAKSNANIKIQPELTLATPVAEVVSLTANEQEDGYTVETSLPALYGPSSPLPRFYTEDLINAELEEHSMARVLLDSIHQRLYRLDHESQRKYDVAFNHVERRNDTFRHLLQSLIGMRQQAGFCKGSSFTDILRFGALFGRRQRSAAGLQVLLEQLLPDCEVEIKQCVARKVRLKNTQRFTLGKHGHCLGENTVFGERLDEHNGLFQIYVRSEIPQAIAWYRQTTKRGEILDWIRLYLDTPLRCELVVELPAEQVHPPALGVNDSWSELGKTTWLVAEQNQISVAATLPVK